MKEMPLMTYYMKVIDNISGEEIMRYDYVGKKNICYYGKCNAKEGGESEFIIEFDIWNNEPAFNAGAYDYKCQDAKNCRLTIWPNKNCSIDSTNKLFNVQQSFMYARCLTFGPKEFKPIKYHNGVNVVGNVNPNIDSIKGCGDHAKVQTKIILPKNSDIPSDRYNFNFSFFYDCE